MTQKILIVDDEADIRNLVKGILEDEGYKTLTTANSKDTYALLPEDLPDLMILDIWLQGSEHDGLEILAEVKARYPFLPVIMISGHGTIETAVSAIKEGAYDFIEKPFKSDRLLLMVRRALETADLQRENRMLKKQNDSALELIGDSSFSRTMDDVIKRVAPTNSRVLLTGEPGTGKDIVARIIHSHSPRAEQPFMMLNCATLRPDMLELELFGAEGTGDQAPHIGILESANGGSLLLDEVGDMPLETQAKIIRVLQEQRFHRIGGDQEIKVDIRIMATSNHNLESLIEEGQFREDLYYRLNVVPIAILPLKERKQDIQPLVQHFTGLCCRDAGISVKHFTEAAIEKLCRYSWPGNVRQLRNVIEWVVIMHGKIEDDSFDVRHLPPDVTGIRTAVIDDAPVVDAGLSDELLGLPLRDAREQFERDYLFAQVERFDGNISKTAEFIGMERSALHRKLKTLQQSVEDKELESLNETLAAKKRA